MAKTCSGEAAITRIPGWSKTSLLPASWRVETYELACSFSPQGGRPIASATLRASSNTTPCGTRVASPFRDVGERHGRAADDEAVSHHASADPTLLESGKDSLQPDPAHEAVVRR